MKVTPEINSKNRHERSGASYRKKKRMVMILVGAFISWATGQVAFGQANEGIITYETKINVHRTLPKERAEMKNMIPEFRVSQQRLFFNSDESLYEPIDEEEDEDMERGSGGIQMRIQQPFVEIYFNRATSTRITQQEFLGKEYLIEDSLNLPPWKFGTETKKILGYNCRQAMYYNEERQQQVVAWYSPELRPFLGPEKFNTLPGGVLEVIVNDGERVIVAKDFQIRSLKKNDIKVPSHGIKTTQSEFRKLVDEHTARMRANGADIIIR